MLPIGLASNVSTRAVSRALASFEKSIIPQEIK
jgi:hypothetical protein